MGTKARRKGRSATSVRILAGESADRSIGISRCGDGFKGRCHPRPIRTRQTAKTPAVPIYPEADEIAAAERHVPVEAGVLRHVADCRVAPLRRLAEDI
jgi:hypothetical protein